MHIWSSLAVAVIAVLGVPIVRGLWRGFQKSRRTLWNRMIVFSEVAIRDAAKQGITLDYGTESIERVETLLSALREQYVANPSQVNLNVKSMSFGAYIGEAIRRNDPNCRNDSRCRWQRDHKVGGPNSYPLHWRHGELFPIAWCYKRIADGEEDNVWIKYKLFRDQIARAALSAKQGT